MQPKCNKMNTNGRERAIRNVTLAGSAINVGLVVFKFVSGIVGCSAAMIADAVHSLSDLLTDAVVLVFVHISEKPQDKDHDYGHGKYETMASSIIGIALLLVGAAICYDGVRRIASVVHGHALEQPGFIALVAALLSIALKEWAYRFTARVGRRLGSPAVIANAWHHRSDALSSVGTAVGIGGAIVLGSHWAVLDPIAAVVVSLLIMQQALKQIRESSDELLEKSLPDDTEKLITDIVMQEPGVSDIHNLCTRRIGSAVAMEMHIRMPGGMTLADSHAHASAIERRLRSEFGPRTHISLHVEPAKGNGADGGGAQRE